MTVYQVPHPKHTISTIIPITHNIATINQSIQPFSQSRSFSITILSLKCGCHGSQPFYVLYECQLV